MGESVCEFCHKQRGPYVTLWRQAVQVHVTGPFRLLCVIQDGGFRGCVWIAVVRCCCDCASCDDVRAIARDLCWQFLQQMEVFLSIVGCGAGGCELGFRRLKPLTWIFGKKGGHDAYGYVCFGDGGGIGIGHPGAAAVAKENVLCAKTAMLC
jgi:hypothetical protein